MSDDRLRETAEPTTTIPTAVSSSSDGNDNLRNIIKYVFAPISRDEIKYYCLIICTILGTALTYFVPNIVSVVFVSLLSLILCLFIATFIWLWTILPHYKRIQFIERVRDIFRHGLMSYLSPSRRTEQTRSPQQDKITHRF